LKSNRVPADRKNGILSVVLRCDFRVKWNVLRVNLLPYLFLLYTLWGACDAVARPGRLRRDYQDVRSIWAYTVFLYLLLDMWESHAVKISFSLQDCVRIAGRDHVCGTRSVDCGVHSVWIIFVQVIAAHLPPCEHPPPPPFQCHCCVVLQEHKSCYTVACVFTSYGATQYNRHQPHAGELRVTVAVAGFRLLVLWLETESPNPTPVIWRASSYIRVISCVHLTIILLNCCSRAVTIFT
jgi:hypothetical protein